MKINYFIHWKKEEIYQKFFSFFFLDLALKSVVNILDKLVTFSFDKLENRLLVPGYSNLNPPWRAIIHPSLSTLPLALKEEGREEEREKGGEKEKEEGGDGGIKDTYSLHPQPRSPSNLALHHPQGTAKPLRTLHPINILFGLPLNHSRPGIYCNTAATASEGATLLC